MTIVELLIVVFLTGLVSMAVAAAYRSGYASHRIVMAELPVAQSASIATTHLAEAVRSATCITSPGHGESGDKLAGLHGVHCGDGTPLEGASPRNFVFCVEPEGRLVYAAGPTNTTPPSMAGGGCRPPPDLTGWKVLTPPVVRVGAGGGALFSRKQTARNQVRVDLLFERRVRTGAAAGYKESHRWRSVLTFQAALDGP